MSRVALVTGGTRGIGAGIAKNLKEKGYTVIASYFGNKKVADKFSKDTGIPVYQWDVKKFSDCKENVEAISKKYGPIEILINNAGITRDSFLHKMEPDAWVDVINTNLNSCFNMTRCVLESMRERNFGRIINISSVNGQKGQIGQGNYSAAKAGVIGLTKALALESAAKGITVNAIAPGYIDTDMVKTIPDTILHSIINQVPTKRLGTVEEVARAVTFLADDKSGYITGATLNLNGGQYLS